MTWTDQFADEPDLLALADQIDAEARDTSPNKARIAEFVLTTLRPRHLVNGYFAVNADNIMHLINTLEE